MANPFLPDLSTRYRNDEMIHFLEKNQTNVHIAYLFSELRQNKWAYHLFAGIGRVLFPGRVAIADELIAGHHSFTYFSLGSLIRQHNPIAHLSQRSFFRQEAVVPVKL